MLTFWKRHKISGTLLLIILIFILYVLIFVMIYNHQKWEIVWPLEDMLAEKYSQDDLYIQHIGVTEDYGELQIWEMHVVVSVEMLNSPTFLENCHEVVEMISEYARQHSNQFTLNCENSFFLSFNWQEYQSHMYSGLRFSNQYHYYIDWKWEEVNAYYDELVDMTIYSGDGVKGISAYDKIMSIDMDGGRYEYQEMVEEVVKMPALKYIDIGKGGSLSLEEKKRYAAKLHENGINSSLWESLYG